jgi:hypothetical protein
MRRVPISLARPNRMIVFIGSRASSEASIAVIHSLSLGIVMFSSGGNPTINAVARNKLL